MWGLQPPYPHLSLLRISGLQGARMHRGTHLKRSFKTVPWNRQLSYKGSMEPSTGFYPTPKKFHRNPKRLYRTPFWPPKRFYGTPAKGFSEPQKRFYRTFCIKRPALRLPFENLLYSFGRGDKTPRGRVNREVQTVNWEAGKKGAVVTGVKSGLKKAHKPWLRGNKGAQTVN